MTPPSAGGCWHSGVQSLATATSRTRQGQDWAPGLSDPQPAPWAYKTVGDGGWWPSPQRALSQEGSRLTRLSGCEGVHCGNGRELSPSASWSPELDF